ncbi:MAG: alpha/beta fold hydrolase [Acidimicrobiales bacterium]
MNGFELEHVRIHGHRVGFRRGGSGPVLLLLHGIAGSSDAWRAVMPELAGRFDVVAPDFMGHGGSAKPVGDYSLGAHASGVRDLMGVLGIPEATIVGQSFGGGVALQLAYQHPECCQRLVLVDSGGLGREVSWLLRLFALPGADVVMPVLFPGFVRDAGDAVSRFLYHRGLRSARAAEMWRAYSSLSAPDNRQAFVRTLRSVIDPGGQAVSALDRLYLAAAVPTLIIWGERDQIIPVSHAHVAHRAIPGSRLEIMEGVGHFPHAEAPQRFVELVTEFIDATPAARTTSERLRALLVERYREAS